MVLQMAAQQFFRQLAANASTWPALASGLYAEVVLTHWLREVHQLPLTDVFELEKTQMFKVREDGSREPAAYVVA